MYETTLSSIALRLEEVLTEKGNFPTLYKIVKDGNCCTATDITPFPFSVQCRSEIKEHITSDDRTLVYLVNHPTFGDIPIEPELLLSVSQEVSHLRNIWELNYIDSLATQAHCFLHSYFRNFGIFVQETNMVFGKLPNHHIVFHSDFTPATCTLIDEKTHKRLDQELFQHPDNLCHSGYAEVMLRIQ